MGRFYSSNDTLLFFFSFLRLSLIFPVPANLSTHRTYLSRINSRPKLSGKVPGRLTVHRIGRTKCPCWSHP
ncbi:hypothetical protein B0H13DRAFT_2043165 [Mycena leptocephala]|nr:hypothetical protein B0H13DRAFT_2043165 [Mycena leptocephala]